MQKRQLDNLSIVRKIAILMTIAIIDFIYLIVSLYFYEEIEYNLQYILVVSVSTFIITMILSINTYINVKDLILNQQQIINNKTKELKKLNIELQQKIEEEVRKNRLKDKIMFHHARMIAMGEMISNIAHQWRQPLNAMSVLIQGFELKKMHGKLTDEFIEEQVKRGLEIANQLSATLDNFNNFFETDDKRDFYNLNEIVKETIQFSNNHNIKFIIDIKKDINIYCKKDDFSQILLTLFNNSLDKFEQIKVPYTKIIKISAKEIENKITIIFIDNGGGIDEKIIDRIFEPYFTTKHKSQGTGLGLFMTKQIIEKQMRGRIWVENINMNFDNKNYKCAKFEITLPVKN